MVCYPRRTPYPGGAPANVACALAQLGSEVVFIGNLGQDDLGDQMADLLTSGCLLDARVQGVHDQRVELRQQCRHDLHWLMQQAANCIFTTSARNCFLPLRAGRGIDLSCLHRTKQPTRDVLVTRSLEGDREFVGFGAAAADGELAVTSGPAAISQSNA